MPRSLTLSRAARLAGVSRGELQDQIYRQAIPTFEGKIEIDALVQAYPHIDLDRDPVLERIALIKAEARPKSSYSDHWLPEPEVLMARLQDFQYLLTRTVANLNNAEELLTEVTEQLEALSEVPDRDLRAAVAHLGRRLRQSLDKAQTRSDRKAELFAKDAMLRIVSASVRLSASGHEFFVEGKDSLLEAGLRAGLHLNYGCTSGNCGTCKVRVISGKVRRIRDHDFVLSAEEQTQGYCLACSNTAVTDLQIEASEALSPKDLPRQEIRCLVRKRETISDDLGLLHVQTPRTQTLRFMAGQRVTLTLEGGEQRDLAIASCPCDGRNLQFLIRDEAGDPFSAGLARGAKGDTLLVEGPQGDFLLEEDAIEPAVFVAVGEGFGPIKSLIEHAIAIDNVARMRLFRIDSVPHGSLLGNLCRSWDDALDNLRYQRLGEDTSPSEAAKAIASACGELADWRVYAAGPAEWVQAFAHEAEKAGARAEYLRVDRMQ